MRLSKIEARRVFTRYGWRPINATNFLTSRGRESLIYSNERYKISVYDSAKKHSLKGYAMVIDRQANERMYFSGVWSGVLAFDMVNDLKLKMDVL